MRRGGPTNARTDTRVKLHNTWVISLLTCDFAQEPGVSRRAWNCWGTTRTGLKTPRTHGTYWWRRGRRPWKKPLPGCATLPWNWRCSMTDATPTTPCQTAPARCCTKPPCVASRKSPRCCGAAMPWQTCWPLTASWKTRRTGLCRICRNGSPPLVPNQSQSSTSWNSRLRVNHRPPSKPPWPRWSWKYYPPRFQPRRKAW